MDAEVHTVGHESSVEGNAELTALLAKLDELLGEATDGDHDFADAAVRAFRW